MPSDSESKKKKHYFRYEEKAISEFAEDTLHRSPFIEALALAIGSWNSEESLVVCLDAAWGEGKTSAANLLAKRLKNADEQHRIISFNPWEWAGRTSLANAFFDEVAIALREESQSGSDELAKAWNRYANRLKQTSILAAHLSKPVRFILGALLIGGVVAGWTRSPFTTFLFLFGVSLIFLSMGLSWFAKLFETFGALSSDGKDAKSLETIKDELKRELNALDRPIVIIVDDLDRLYPANMANLLQVIASNGDLPHLVYIILADKRTLAAHLSDELKVDGNCFLEKVIDVSLPLPIAATSSINDALFAGMNDLLRDSAVMRLFDSTRWSVIFQTLISPYVTNLRNVKRLLNNLYFHKDLLLGEHAFEVNPVDLIAIESLNLFEPKLHRELIRKKFFLTHGSPLQRPTQDEAQKILQEILNHGSLLNRRNLERAIRALFPLVDNFFNSTQSYGFDQKEWSYQSRVAAEHCFDRYFRFATSEDDVSENEIRALLIAETKQSMSEWFSTWEKRGITETALTRLLSYDQDVPKENMHLFLSCLFDVGDKLTSETDFMYGTPSMRNAEQIVQSLLIRFSKMQNPLNLLGRAMDDSVGCSLAAHIAIWLTESKHCELRDLVTEESTKSLIRHRVIENIEKSARENTLIRLGDAGLLLDVWGEWTNSGEAEAYVRENINSVEWALDFLKAKTSTSHVSGTNRKGGTKRWHLRPSQIEKFIPFATLRSILAPERLDRLHEVMYQPYLESLRSAERRVDAGKPEPENLFGYEEQD